MSDTTYTPDGAQHWKDPATGIKTYQARLLYTHNGRGCVRLSRRSFRRASEAEFYGYAMVDRMGCLRKAAPKVVAP